MLESVLLIGLSVIISVIGFFIYRFFNTVDKISDQLEDIKIKMAVREESIQEIRKDVHEIRLKQTDHSKRLHDIEIQLAKSK